MNNLGKKITTLRNKQNMSQGDLANQMNVSRQSVSKWETGSSVPDVDKLIQLSEIFHVSIDELVKENKDSIETENEVNTKISESGSKGISAEVFLIMIGLVSCVLGILLANISGILGIYIILCCILSIKMKNLTLFVCLWTTILVLAVYSPDVYSLFAGERSILILGVWLCALLVSVYTIWLFYKAHQNKEI